MKQKIQENIEIPEGIECSYIDGILRCKNGDIALSKDISLREVSIEIKNNEIVFSAEKANKTTKNLIASNKNHIRNMFKGLDEKFSYKLEACNVHFPMTLKIEKDILSINNFLGEKISRHAKILPEVEVKINGSSIIVSSHSKELAGQTAANIETATKVRGRDRRIFQDGIFITEKPGDKKK